MRNQDLAHELYSDLEPYRAGARDHFEKLLELQQTNFLKKMVTMRRPDAKAKAIDKWRQANEKCKKLHIPPTLDHPLATAYGIAKDFLRRAVYDERRETSSSTALGTSLRYPILPENGKFGPGKTLLCDNESQACKLAFGTHTYTDSYLRAFYRISLLGNPRTFNLELSREKNYGSKQVRASKLVTVPKTDDIDRVICIEPLLNMFFQQSVRYSLEKSLERLGINLSTQQSKQRTLARIGSKSGYFATLDLSSASDTISYSFCESFLPKELFEALKLGRCSHTLVGDEEVELNMISSMGNATTFPLQTLIFLSLSIGVMTECGIDYRLHFNSNVGVNGDDIILPSQCALMLIELLEMCGFVVNTSKTFILGPYRESCGGDYYSGYIVTPVRIKTLASRSDIFSAYNRLLVWSARHGVNCERTLTYLRNSVNKPNYIPMGEAVDRGFWKLHKKGRYRGLTYAGTKKRIKTSISDSISLFLASAISQDHESNLVPLRGRGKARLSVCVSPSFPRTNEYSDWSPDQSPDPTLMSQDTFSDVVRLEKNLTVLIGSYHPYSSL